MTSVDSELGLYSDLDVKIQLTEKGVKNVDQVLEAVFKYNQRIAEVGPSKDTYDELKKVGDMRFEF